MFVKAKFCSKIRGKITGEKKKGEGKFQSIICQCAPLYFARIKNSSKSDALQFEEYKVEEQAVATSSTEISRGEWEQQLRAEILSEN